MKNLDKICKHAEPVGCFSPVRLYDCKYTGRCQYKISFGYGYFCKQELERGKVRDYRK